ncbi:MAG: hypothetical protein AAB402_03745 [Patescibacteria group bacterium]
MYRTSTPLEANTDTERSADFPSILDYTGWAGKPRSPLTGSILQASIIRALVYYDTFDYPLTVEEAWRWLYPPPNSNLSAVTVADVQREVEMLAKEGKLERRGAYVFCPGRQSIVDTRIERMPANAKLWRRAASTARFLELVPFVKMIAVVNTLAIDNARPASDIDLLIVTAPRHIWIARMIVTGIVSLLGYRRHGTTIAGRVCLSFYVTTDGMDFSALKSADPDIHFTFWTAQAVPLLDDGTYERYRQANDWVMKLLPNAWVWKWPTRLLVPNPGLRVIKQFYEIFLASPIGHWLESWARDRQLKKMEKNIESKAKLGTTEVVISEDVLKFHELDRRQEYNERFRRRLVELGLAE